MLLCMMLSYDSFMLGQLSAQPVRDASFYDFFVCLFVCKLFTLAEDSLNFWRRMHLFSLPRPPFPSVQLLSFQQLAVTHVLATNDTRQWRLPGVRSHIRNSGAQRLISCR